MNKCEHNERITQFCATDCCVWKEAAGCESCMKKYHNHMGTTVFLAEEEVLSIVRKYTMDSNIKPKCRLLQEAIYGYFNLIKGELTTSLDAACKNIINQIGYPYLYANGTLSTYKRLKNKQYKKLLQKDFKCLYELTQKISDKELVSEEAKIYINQMKLTEELMNGLEDTVKKYEGLIKKYYPTFTHDTQHILKINDIFKHLANDSPKTSQSKVSQHKHKDDKKTAGPVYLFKQKQQERQAQVKIQQVPPAQPATRIPAIGMPPSLIRPNYSRDVSIDKKIIKQHKFVGLKAERQGSEKQLLGKAPMQREQSQRIEAVKQELNSKEAQINEKKNMLIEMMRQKEDSIRTGKEKSKDRSLNEKKQRIQNKVFNERKQYQPSHFIHPTEKTSQSVVSKPSDIKSTALQTRSITDRGKSLTQQSYLTIQERPQTLQMKKILKSISNQQEKGSMSSSKSPGNSQQELEEQSFKASNDIQNYAFTRLPVQQKPLPQLNQSQVERRLIVIPTAGLKEGRPEQIQSPLLKKKNIIDRYREATRGDTVVQRRLFQEKAQETDRLLELIPIYHKKTDTVLELKENEEKSLALLLKSLALKAQEAVVYLQQAIIYADNNLSAAEYLSFLYLELNRPSDCLKLCNRIIQRIQNSSEPEELLLIVNNNKAAALNIMGRYSQSIVLLERCLRLREKDYFYKNLGDAYFSMSMYEKAIYNYEKALRSNDQYDQAHYNLAVCLYVQENYHNAKLAIHKAIQINSTNEHYHQLLSNIDTRINHY